MASKKFIELSEFSQEDLINELKETEAQFQKFKFDHAIKGVENPLTIKEMRRDIARLKTEVRRREVAAMDAEALAGRSKIRSRRRRS